MFGVTRKILHRDTISRLRMATAFTCLSLAGVLSEIWAPVRLAAAVDTVATPIAVQVTPRTSPLPVSMPPIAAVTANKVQLKEASQRPAKIEQVITAESLFPSAPASSITLSSAKTLLCTNEVFANLLQPEGFKRDEWQAFKHIELNNKVSETVTKQRTEQLPGQVPELATLSPVPSIGKTDIAAAVDATFTILIDPGHGGWDPGSVAHNGLMEKHLTLDIARRVELFLSEVPDINVILTRRDDTSLRRKARVNKIKETDTDLVVSLHFNHLPQPNVNLVESFYAGPDDIKESQKLMRQANAARFHQVANSAPLDLTFTHSSKRLANMLHKRVFNEVSLDNEHVINAGVKTDMLYVLTQSFTPGVLMELTAISNIEEAERLADEDYRNRLAAALADGIRNYRESLHTNPLNGTGT